MAWCYRKRIKIIPGIHLNLSKSGISTSIGVRGANLTFQKNGTYLNTGLPGTGIYNRQKIPHSNLSNNQNQNDGSEFLDEQTENIFSVDIGRVTSQNMEGIKEAILLARHQRRGLRSDLVKIKIALFLKIALFIGSYLIIIGFIKKKIPNYIRTDIRTIRLTIQRVSEQIMESYVGLDVDFESEIQLQYENLVSAFKDLCKSKKIWDVTFSGYEDSRLTRSPFSTKVKKSTVRFSLNGLDDIKSDYEVLKLKNANGPDFYVYPNFIVMYSNKEKFAVIGFDELKLSQDYIHFVETGVIPSDAKIIDKTWAKVNNDGSRDRRFKSNYKIPVLLYGQINLSTETGVNEEYEFSNFEYCKNFANAFLEYQETIIKLQKVSS